MELDEWCALVHVDIGMRSGLEVIEEAIQAYVAGASGAEGTLDLRALKDERRPNHFEVIGRYRDEAAYRSHQVHDATLAFRRAVGPVLGSPYEDRLHGPLGAQDWQLGDLGDFVTVTQVEARPDELDAAKTRLEAYLGDLGAVDGSRATTALERRFLGNNLEILTLWESPEAFDGFIASGAATTRRVALEELLLAPIEDRRLVVFA